MHIARQNELNKEDILRVDKALADAINYSPSA